MVVVLVVDATPRETEIKERKEIENKALTRYM
jgi:hypothetical protein